MPTERSRSKAVYEQDRNRRTETTHIRWVTKKQYHLFNGPSNQSCFARSISPLTSHIGEHERRRRRCRQMRRTCQHQSLLPPCHSCSSDGCARCFSSSPSGLCILLDSLAVGRAEPSRMLPPTRTDVHSQYARESLWKSERTCARTRILIVAGAFEVC